MLLLRHNILLTDTYLPYSIFLAQSLKASVSKGAAGTIFTPFVWCGRDLNPQPPPLRKWTIYQLSYLGCLGTRREYFEAKNNKTVKIPSYRAAYENVYKYQKNILIRSTFFGLYRLLRDISN